MRCGTGSEYAPKIARQRASSVLRCQHQVVTAYTSAQAEAIACLDEPLQIIACAGSGKTQVISQRIAAILAQPGVQPRNVVAFTFTEKAAAELK